MRIRLILSATSGSGSVIPINYQYPLSAAIYKILQKADSDYSDFLHESGYGKGFKLFTFSDLQTPFQIVGDRLKMRTPEAEVIISFYLPRAAETFVKGLFMAQQLVIADSQSKVDFTVQQAVVLSDKLQAMDDETPVDVLFNPISPVVCGIKNEKGNYAFLSPDDEPFEEMIWRNWQEKVRSVFGPAEADYLMHSAFIQTRYFKNPPKSRLITIKSGMKEETKIRGFSNFLLQVKGKKKAVELLLNAGIGLYNAQGMGCVEMVES